MSPTRALTLAVLVSAVAGSAPAAATSPGPMPRPAGEPLAIGDQERPAPWTDGMCLRPGRLDSSCDRYALLYAGRPPARVQGSGQALSPEAARRAKAAADEARERLRQGAPGGVIEVLR